MYVWFDNSINIYCVLIIPNSRTKCELSTNHAQQNPSFSKMSAPIIDDSLISETYTHVPTSPIRYALEEKEIEKPSPE